MSGVPHAQAGVAAGDRLHQPPGRPVARRGHRGLGGGVHHARADAAGFVDASHVGWWIITGCGLVVLIVGLVTSGRWARQTAARTADRLMSEEEPVPVG